MTVSFLTVARPPLAVFKPGCMRVVEMEVRGGGIRVSWREKHVYRSEPRAGLEKKIWVGALVAPGPLRCCAGPHFFFFLRFPQSLKNDHILSPPCTAIVSLSRFCCIASCCCSLEGLGTVATPLCPTESSTFCAGIQPAILRPQCPRVGHPGLLYV